jgi:hypothetical protein
VRECAALRALAGRGDLVRRDALIKVRHPCKRVGQV